MRTLYAIDIKTTLHFVRFQDSDAQVIEHIIKSGCEVNVADKQGCSPLHIAVVKGNIAVVTALIDQGANIEAFTADGYRCVKLISATVMNSVCSTFYSEHSGLCPRSN